VQPRKAAKKLEAEELFEYAVKYLGMRACSTDELKARLRLRAARASDIEPTIDRLKEINYLNDERFAESYAANRLGNEGFGRMRVLNDLRGRRVPPKLAEKAVEQVFKGRTEGDLVDAFIERRMPSIAKGGKIEDDKILARAYARLRRAGFSSGGSLAALKRLASRPEDLLEPPDEDEVGD
jgi:regulatory protein